LEINKFKWMMNSSFFCCSQIPIGRFFRNRSRYQNRYETRHRERIESRHQKMTDPSPRMSRSVPDFVALESCDRISADGQSEVEVESDFLSEFYPFYDGKNILCFVSTLNCKCFSWARVFSFMRVKLNLRFNLLLFSKFLFFIS
jgi:hypothetical protein